MSDSLLSVEDLAVRFVTDAGAVDAVDGVSLRVDRGETVCLVGESGSGKTALCESITGLLASPPAEVTGTATFDGRDLLTASDAELRAVRGDRIAHVFQNPQGALDPVYTVGDQIAEAVLAHRDVSDRFARERAVELLRRVGISRPRERVDAYPHEFSTGMCQRVAVAIALAAEPDLIVADEPTSALDVTVQARILELFADLRRERDLSLLFVTHDLRVVAAVADRVVVMYDGVAVEEGSVDTVFDAPAHPYTQALFDSFVDGTTGREDDTPDGGDDGSRPSGCRFRLECPHAVEACAETRPPFEAVDGDERHRAACVYHGAGFDANVVLHDADVVADDADVVLHDADVVPDDANVAGGDRREDDD